MLDPRRTPVSITDLEYDTGMFGLRIDDFEDEGARWELPFEEIDRFQFALGSDRAAPDDLDRIQEAIDRLDVMVEIACEAAARDESRRRIVEQRGRAVTWLTDHSEFLAGDRKLPDVETRMGEPVLWRDLTAWMETLDLVDVEGAFTSQYVSAPHSGEVVKGHRIVLAELGLVDYIGKIVRDPRTFDGAWSRRRRADHIVARLAFVSALFACLDRTHLTLYRGLSTPHTLTPPRRTSFVSTSFSRAVCESHFEGAGPDSAGLLLRQAVPVDRVFMTYLETEAMNRQFLEAEAVLLESPENLLF